MPVKAGLLFERRLEIDCALVWIVPLLVGMAAAILPPDANIDLANYHFYNPWAFVTGRGGQNFFPSNLQAFFNPLIDVPFYLANTVLPGRAVSFLLGLVEGLCFPLLYGIARLTLFPALNRRAILTSAAIAGAGMTAGYAIAELGTTYGDYVGSLGTFVCLGLLAGNLRRLQSGPLSAVAIPVILAGSALGGAIGLKQTSIFLALGIGSAMPILGCNWRRGLAITALFAIGGVIGLLVLGGPWMFVLWKNYQNPIFPFFNNIIGSSFAPHVEVRDIRYLPRDWLEALLYPFVFALDPGRVGDVPLEDLRLPALYAAVPVGLAFLYLAPRASINDTDIARRRYLTFLLLGLGVAIAAWILLFSYRRYALVLDMLAPLVIALLARELPRPATRWIVGTIAILALVVTTRPITLGRWHWGPLREHLIGVELPDMDVSGDMVLLVGWRPKAFVIPFFPTDVSFVRVSGDPPSNVVFSKLKSLVADRIATHSGRFVMLIHSEQITDPSDPPAWTTIDEYGLKARLDECKALRTTLDVAGPLLLCPVERAP
jgi:hypothetical protein